MSRHINQAGLEDIKRWEGLRLVAYQDSAGVWTIGYGHTAAAGAPAPKAGMRISAAEAEEILRRDLARFEAAVERLVKVPLSDNQFAALVSFAFNVGEGAMAKSTLLRRLNAGDYEAVPAELMKWTRAGGRVVQGLANRRAAEAGRWSRGAFVASQDVAPEPKRDSVLTQPETLAAGGALAGSAFTAASSPGPLQWAIAFAVVVAVVAGIVFFVRRIREARA